MKWEYQGKRKDQVESSIKIFAWSLILLIVAVIFVLIIDLLL